MNCLEFRRHCLSEPGSQDHEFLRHKHECSRCADYAVGVGQLDRKLAEALDVKVPDNLASRIILRQSIEGDRTRKRRKLRLYALAASLLFAIGLGTGLVVRTWTEPYDRMVLTHIDTEKDYLLTRQEAPDAKLVLQTVGVELKGELANLRHASLCRLTKEPGAHLVFDGQKGPVIVLVLPKESIADHIPIRSDRFAGIVVPTSNGGMAIVGEHGEDLYDIERTLRSNLTWRF